MRTAVVSMPTTLPCIALRSAPSMKTAARTGLSPLSMLMSAMRLDFGSSFFSLLASTAWQSGGRGGEEAEQRARLVNDVAWSWESKESIYVAEEPAA